LSPSLELAFHIAKTGRPGPVLVDIPSDIQKARIDIGRIKKANLDKYVSENKIDNNKVEKVYQMIKKSEKLLIISGGGVIMSNSTRLLKEFIEKNNLPIVTTLMGKGVYPSKSELYFDGLGMHGTYYGNYAVQNSDLILALGVRFSDRILGDMKRFAPNAKIIHIDIDRSEIGKNVKPILSIKGDVQNVLEKLISFPGLKNHFSDWIRELNEQKIKYPLIYKKGGKLKPQYLIELANKYFPEDTIVVSDVGQNQMWTAQFYRFKRPRTFLTSGGLGTMGFGLPAAIGAKVGNPDSEVLMISGDGGFQMNIQELITIKRYNLNIKMLIVDNTYLGMVKQWQELFYNKRYSATPFTDNPDFGAIAKVIGIKSMMVKDWSKAERVMKEFSLAKESILVHALVDPEEDVFPMVPPGASLNNILLSKED